MTIKERLKYQGIITAIIVAFVFTVCRECGGAFNMISGNVKKDTIYITKPRLVDILKDTSLTNQLKKIFGKKDSFVITKYIPIKVHIKDSIMVPVITTHTVLVLGKDSIKYLYIHSYNKSNKDSSLFYGFIINTEILKNKDSVYVTEQKMKDFYLKSQLTISEVQRVRKYWFDETMVVITHPKEMSVDSKPYYVKTRKKRTGLGLFAGVGVIPQTPYITPVVGIGLTFNPIMIR